MQMALEGDVILANVRDSLTREDAQLALRLLARGAGTDYQEAEAQLRDGGIDAVLDDPRLLAALLRDDLGMRASLPMLCYVLVRQALRQLGEGDRTVADYVASVLMHFGVRDRATRVAEADDEEYDTLAGLLEAANSVDARRNFLVRAHLGNYALWLSGLFPDRIEHRRWRKGGPDLEYYEEIGKRGFLMAADHRLAREQGVDTLFVAVAERFVLLRLALNHISDTLLFPSRQTPDRLMRQVRDEVRWRLTD